MLRIRNLNSFASIFAKNKGSLLASRAVRQPIKFSQCVPHHRLKLVLVCFFSADSICWIGVRARRSVGPSDHSDWLFSWRTSAWDYCHLLVRKCISSYSGAERTCATWPSDVERRLDVSWARSLLSSPLVHRRRLGVFRKNILKFMESFHWTKCSLYWKKVLKFFFQNVLHIR